MREFYRDGEYKYTILEEEDIRRLIKENNIDIRNTDIDELLAGRSKENVFLSPALLHLLVENMVDDKSKADVTVTDGLASDIAAINTLLASDDVSLDELQEIVNYIKNNRDDIDALGIASIAGLQTALDKRILSTSGAPDNADGADGSYAIDVVAQVAYGPKSAGVWPSGVSFKGADAVNQIGHIFPSNTERDAYTNTYSGMISRQIDTDADTQYDGASWVSYTGSLPMQWVGAPAIADVTGHLPDGKRYTEEA